MFLQLLFGPVVELNAFLAAQESAFGLVVGDFSKENTLPNSFFFSYCLAKVTLVKKIHLPNSFFFS